MPKSGIRKIKPIKPPQSAPPAAPAAAVDGWCSLTLPSGWRSTITASASSRECSFTSSPKVTITCWASATSSYAIATRLLTMRSSIPLEGHRITPTG